jgi:hypothetical protein
VKRGNLDVPIDYRHGQERMDPGPDADTDARQS